MYWVNLSSDEKGKHDFGIKNIHTEGEELNYASVSVQEKIC